MPENSIKCDNRFFIQPTNGKLFACVEISLTNTMKEKVFINKLQVLHNADARLVETQGIDTTQQAISRRSTYKFIVKYELVKDVNVLKDFGRIQFTWKSESPDIDGGILEYNVICKEKKPDDVQVERANSEVLKKFEVCPITLFITNQ